MENIISQLSPFSKNSKQPFFIQLHTILRAYILENNLPADTKLPNESELMKLYKISRGTVRNAIERLAVENLVYKIKGKGTFVAKPLKVYPLAVGMTSSDYTIHSFMGTEIRHIDMGEPDLIKAWSDNLQLSPAGKTFRVRRQRLQNNHVIVMEIIVFPDFIADYFTLDQLKNAEYLPLLNMREETKVCSIKYTAMARSAHAVAARFLEISEDTPYLYTTYTYYTADNVPIATGSIAYLAEQSSIEMLVHIDNSNSNI